MTKHMDASGVLIYRLMNIPEMNKQSSIRINFKSFFFFFSISKLIQFIFVINENKLKQYIFTKKKKLNFLI